MGALSGPMEALLLSMQGETGKGIAATSEAGLIRSLTATALEAGRAEVTGAMVAGRDQEIEEALPHREGQREEPPRPKVHRNNKFQ